MDETGLKPEYPHDHTACIAGALTMAEALCARRGVRLTALRRRVLELVWSSHRAVKAYDLLGRLSADAGSAKPPTVYRALEFLLEQGLIHRIESLNAYVGCPSPRDGHASQFLICGACETVIELDGGRIEDAVADAADRHGFSVVRKTVEVHGRCARCRPEL